VNTELRVAYKGGIKLSLQENPDEVAPYKFLKGAVQAVEKVVTEKLKVFNKISS
jgi:fructose-bisphosphate aldolase, class II